MAKYKFIRGATNNIASTNRVDGQILFDTTLHQLYFDVKRANSNVVDRFLLDTEVDTISDELILSMFDDDDILVYGSVEDFPASGQDGKVYYASDERKFYTWDGTDYEEYDIDDSSLVYKIDDASGDSIDDADYIPYFDLSANTKKRILFSTIKTAMAAIYENKTAVENGTDLSLVTTGDKYNWDHAGTVTSVATGAGLTGGPVTLTGTIKVNLVSEITSSLASNTASSVSGRQYPVELDSNGKLSVNVPWEDTNTVYESKTAAENGTDVSLVTTGEKYAWNNILGNLDVDSTPTQNSTKPVSSGGVYTALGSKVNTSAVGTANGVAELDANGKVPSSQLPSYVDDVVEGYLKAADGKFYKESTYTTEITGEDSKIYLDLTSNLPYRWGGSSYVAIASSLALGETSTTAYRGDRGKTAYNHASDSSRLTTAKTEGLYKVATTAEGHIASATAVAKSDITALGIPAQDTTYESKEAAQNGTDLSLVTTGEKYAWNNKSTTSGTVTKVSTGVGLVGGDITSTGTVKAKLKSETASTLEASAMGNTASRQYAVGVDKDGNLSVNVPWEDNNTWIANSSSAAGYVASGSGQNKKAWMTDASGNPAWRDFDEMSAISENYIMGLFDDDDVLSYASKSSFPSSGNSSKIYYAVDEDKFYKWNGSSYVEYNVSNDGTVRGVTAGVGLAGGTITDTGTIKAKLKSETASSLTAASKGSTSDREYAVGVDASGDLSVNIPWENTTYESKNAASGGTALSLVTTGEKYTWNSKTANTGTVTNLTAGVGLAGGTVTTTGTIKAKLKSETASSLASASMGSTASRQYAVGVDKDGYLSVNIPWTDTVATIYNQTLTAGNTDVTFNSLPTSGTNLFDVYTSVAGLDYESMTSSNNGASLTITYEAQSSDITVYLRVDHRA